MLQRSPSYIASLPAKNPLADLLRKVLPERYAGGVIRWFNALVTQGFYQLSQRRPAAGQADAAQGRRARSCPPGYDIDTHFTPRYNPWDQRLCVVPDGDLFKAISAGHGVGGHRPHRDLHREGPAARSRATELEADIIVTATGLELLFIGGIAAVGRRRGGRPRRAG